MYPAKLLLFGEHLLLLGAPAVAVPVPAFSGRWARQPLDLAAVNLRAYLQSPGLVSVQEIDRGAFAKDLAAGLYFDSDIPRGYGLGSSGALCAAVYDRYAREKTAVLGELKTIFAQMESFFHGHSSGIDPLTSYLRQPVLIEAKTEVHLPVLQPCNDRPLVFLLDSRLPRQTGPLVAWFLEQSRQVTWRARLEKDLLPAHTVLVESWLQGRATEFWTALRQVSLFQFEHFQPMVPTTLRDLWRASFEQENLAFKICGAGGGGFLLGFAKEPAAIALLQQTYSLVLPFEKQHVSHAQPEN